MAATTTATTVRDSAHRPPARVDQPHIRQGWLEHGPAAAARGSDVFVPVTWEATLELLATEPRRVYGTYGPDGVSGGPMAGPARAGSIMPRASCTGS